MRLASLCAVICVAAATALTTSGSKQHQGPARPWIGVKGRHLVDRQGQPVRLLGVNRSGTDYRCVENGDVFGEPHDAASIATMVSWHINAVRLTLNESCWLGINGVPAQAGGSAYQEAIRGYVGQLEAAGLYVILDLQWVGPGDHLATGLTPMPDADHAPAFWSSVANAFRRDHGVLFDLFNEPQSQVSWDCWENGCWIHDRYIGGYQAAGMQQLVDSVRAAGSRQPVLLSGINWANDLTGWLDHRPRDPAHALVAAKHSYDFGACYSSCHKTLLQIGRQVPVVTTEMGETDCGRSYIVPYMNWADRHDISYLAWAWNAGDGWDCKSGPSLIKDFSGAPTYYGAGYRRHLRRIAARCSGPHPVKIPGFCAARAPDA